MKLNYKITRNVCYRCFSTWLYASMICSWQRCVKKGRMTSTLFQYVSNKMQRYTVYLYLEISVRVSGGISTHRQEHTQLYLQHLVLLRPLLLPAALKRQVAVTVWQVPDAVDTVVCAPDDGWRYHPKHVQQFPDINKLCNVASCWIYLYIWIHLRCTDPWTSKMTSTVLWHSNVNDHDHTSAPLVPFLSQTSAVRSFPPNFFKANFNSSPTLTPRSS